MSILINYNTFNGFGSYSGPFDECEVIRNYFRREPENAFILKKKFGPRATHITEFISPDYVFPIMLWADILKYAKSKGIQFSLTQTMSDYLNSFKLDKDAFTQYINDLFKNAKNEDGSEFKPREYQINAAYTLLRFKNACGEISTSAGKTLISYMIIHYIKDNYDIKRSLYIVPSVDLVKQTGEKFELYDNICGLSDDRKLKVGLQYGASKKVDKANCETCDVMISTYQSLSNRLDEDIQYALQFDALFLDEAHHGGSAQSLQEFLKNLKNCKFKIGVTGTFPKEKSLSYLQLQTKIGTLVYKLSADNLINEQKAATPIYIIFQILNWAVKQDKRALYYSRLSKIASDDAQIGAKLLKQEQQFINASDIRLRYICDMADKIKVNLLVLFGDIKYGYGKKMHEYMQKYSNKHTYYIDGNTPSDVREAYKQACKNDNEGKTVIFGSINTMGEGIDVPNIAAIFLVNTVKSDRIVRQIVGRGLRLSEGKDKCVLYDFVDDLRYTEDGRMEQNYMYKHYLERLNIYKSQNFPIYKQKIDFGQDKGLDI